MKLYTTPGAPNPARVHFVLAEKGIELPFEEISVMKGVHKTPEYRAKVPNGRVPALEFDDGTVLCETVAICRYLEAEHPSPNLFGADAREQAQIEMWSRMMEMELFLPMGMAFRHTHPAMGALEDQVPEFGEKQRGVASKRLQRLDRELDGRDYLVGNALSMADVIAYTGLRFFRVAGFEAGDDTPTLKAWYERVSAHDGAKACTLR